MLYGLFPLELNGDEERPQDDDVTPTHDETDRDEPVDDVAEGYQFDQEFAENETLRQINDIRQERGLDPLEPNEALRVASREHSRDMLERSYFSHESPDGTTPHERIMVYDSSCRATGENLFLTYWDRPLEGDERIESNEQLAEALVEGWMDSEGHRENILRDMWSSSGVGIVISEDGEVYATHKFCG